MNTETTSVRTVSAPATRTKRSRRRTAVLSIAFALVAVLLFVGVILYDSGANAAWAKTVEDLESPDQVKLFVEQWPGSTVARRARPHAAKLYAERVRAVEMLLVEAERLQTFGDFDAVGEYLVKIAGDGTPVQKERYQSLTTWIAGEIATLSGQTAQFETHVRDAHFMEAFDAYRDITCRFPKQSRELSFPACINSLPKAAQVGHEQYTLGTTPQWVECTYDVRLRIFAPGYFTEELTTPEAWSDPFPQVKLRPIPHWMVPGGGRFTIAGGCLFLMGNDGILRLIEPSSGRVYRRFIYARAYPGSGPAVPFCSYFAVAGNGTVTLFDARSLQEIRVLAVGPKDQRVFIAALDRRRLLVGNTRIGTLVLRDPICRVESKIAGRGPATAFVTSHAGVAYTTAQRESVLWRNYGIRSLGSSEHPRLVSLGETVAGVAPSGLVSIWDVNAKLRSTFTIYHEGLTPDIRLLRAHENHLAVVLGAGALELITLPDGAARWRRHLDGGNVYELALDGNHVFAAMKPSGVYVLDAASGTPLSHVPTEGSAQIARCGDLLIVSDNRSLYAYQIR